MRWIQNAGYRTIQETELEAQIFGSGNVGKERQHERSLQWEHLRYGRMNIGNEGKKSLMM